MFLTVDTGNTKLVGVPRRGFAAALSLPIKQTCPASCPLKAECYALGGRLALHVRRLEALSRGRTVLSIAKGAALEILAAAANGLAVGRPLRFFQAGDARTEAAARVLAHAGRAWIRAGGSAAWGYTHAWRDVPRGAWRGVSMLASVENLDDGKRALKAGYAPARVVSEHPVDGRAFDQGGVRWIPCPEQTRGVPCVACGLCFDDRALVARKSGIAFAAHGNRREQIKRRLPMMQGGH